MAGKKGMTWQQRKLGYQPGMEAGPFTVLSVVGRPEGSHHVVYRVRCRCGAVSHRTSAQLVTARGKGQAGCRECRFDREFTTDRRAAIIEAVMQTHNPVAAAKEVGVSIQRVHQVLHAEGFGRRWVRLSPDAAGQVETPPWAGSEADACPLG